MAIPVELTDLHIRLPNRHHKVVSALVLNHSAWPSIVPTDNKWHNVQINHYMVTDPFVDDDGDWLHVLKIYLDSEQYDFREVEHFLSDDDLLVYFYNLIGAGEWFDDMKI